MSRGRLLGIVIAVVVLITGAIVIHTEIPRPVADIHQDLMGEAPTNDEFIAQQRKAQAKSERDAMDSACAALRQLGGKDKNCPVK
jgi:hypothetical protein